ncbi:MAG: MATE family efflux transporter [Bacteroidales bacterium]|nr:MATE family efflux transporter [Bacteroidales bacterium]
MKQDLTIGRPAKVIFFYSLPVILGNVFQQVYNFVDNVIVGRAVGYEALAGVGVTTGMTFLILGFIIGITSGLGVRTAQYFGAGDMAGVRRSIGTSIWICIAISALMTAVALLLADPLLRAMGADESIYRYARDYVIILFAGLSTQTAYNLISSILRAVGDSKTPLYFLVFSSILNVILDLAFMYGAGWGVKGAAIATVLAQFISAAACFIYTFAHYRELRLSREDFRTSWALVNEHVRIGLPMAFQFSITAIGTIFLNAALAGFPAPYIAGFAAANRITGLFAQVPVSFGVAMANFAGQNFGAGKLGRVRQGVRATCVMSMLVCVVASSVLLLFPHQLTSLFVDGADSVADIFDASRRYLRVSASLYPFLFLIFIFRNALQGIGRPFWPLMGGVGELVIRAITSFILPQRFGYTGVIYVDCLSWVLACLILAVAYYFIMMRKGRRAISA